MDMPARRTGEGRGPATPADQPQDQVWVDLEPVLALAGWAFGTHQARDVGGATLCPHCRVARCDPYRWADAILTAMASIPFLVVRHPTG